MKPELKIGSASPPTLKALRAIEAVVRHKSLTLAARELNVTVSAIAFQVSNAEAALGRELVRREGRGLRVSPEAEGLAEDLRLAFFAIDAAARKFANPPKPTRVVKVTLLANFAVVWLLPRLRRFWEAHPEVDLRIATSERMIDLLRDGIDCAVRVGPGRWKGLISTPLFPQRLSPVCHVTYLHRFGQPKTCRDLGRHLLIRDARRDSEWSEWFQLTGEVMAPSELQEVQGREMVSEAVNAGLGIGLLDISLLSAQIRSGELVRLFPAALDTGWMHWLVVPEETSPTAACGAFLDWLRSEASEVSLAPSAQT